ncbi:MAG: 16S rRNA (guanine(527)-N(7))-methyltransferase RsmG [Planctomycetaceae bacterium]
MIESLTAVLLRCGVELSDESVALLDQYCERLWDWNRKLNLTRHTDPEAFVTRDLLDTQQLAEHIASGETVLDIGSGGGVPGVPMAILRPDLCITLAESSGRKAAALKAILGDLKLAIPVLAERGEDILKTRTFDTATARAVAPLKKLLPLLRPVRNSFGKLLLIKGPNWVSERKEAEAGKHLRGFTIDVLAEYATPGRDGRSVILQIVGGKS